MPDLPPPPHGGIRFPGGKPGGKTLSLPRRRVATRSPFEVSAASAEARRQIQEIVSATRSPWEGQKAAVSAERSAELERSLRQLEMKLAERERFIEDAEMRLAEREREMAEAEALLRAREQLLRATRRPAVERPAQAVSQEEASALQALKAELDKQEQALNEAREALHEREAFLDESENKLFEKVQAQQEKETELEQQAEDLALREKHLLEREAVVDPAAAAELKLRAETKKAFDEFNE